MYPTSSSYDRLIKIKETTTDATPLEVFSIDLAEGENYDITAYLSAQSTDGKTHIREGIGYNFRRLVGGAALRSTGGRAPSNSNGAPDPEIDLDVDGNSVKCYLVGTTKEIAWKGYIEYNKVR